jgi:hypothetical protein
MIFVDSFYFGSDANFLFRVAEQVADHPHMRGVGEFDQHDYVRDCVLERGMSRIPDALPTVDSAASGELVPSEFERMALVTYPFGSEL